MIHRVVPVSGVEKSDLVIHIHIFGEGNGLLAWKIPWAEEPGGLQSMGSRRVGHD